MTRLMTEKETALMVGMSVHWLRRKRWEGGGIPFIKMSQRGAVRYAEDTVQEYLTAHFRTSTSDSGDDRHLLSPDRGTGGHKKRQ